MQIFALFKPQQNGKFFAASVLPAPAPLASTDTSPTENLVYPTSYPSPSPAIPSPECLQLNYKPELA